MPTPAPAAPGPVLVPPKPAEPAAAAPTKPEVAATGVPEKYEFKLPDGFAIAAEDDAAFSAYAREMGFDNAKAQKGIDLATAFGQRLVASANEAREKATTEQDATWRAALDADPAIGGAQMPKTVELLSRARATFDPKNEVGDLLATHGLANNPALVRLFRSVGEALREDAPPPGAERTPAAPTDMAALLYPNDRPRS